MKRIIVLALLITLSSMGAALNSTADHNYSIINVTKVPEDVAGASGHTMLSIAAITIIVCIVLIFSAKLAKIGLILSAGAVGFFAFIGWLPISGLNLVVVYVITVLFLLASSRGAVS